MTRDEELSEWKRMFYFVAERSARYSSAKWRVGTEDRTALYHKRLIQLEKRLEQIIELHDA